MLTRPGVYKHYNGCFHPELRSLRTSGGTCAANKYEHAKHTGEPRDLSIHSSGACPKFSMDEESFCLLDGFSEFA